MATQKLKKIYFTAGPAKIPDEVMQQAQDELLDYKGMGISVCEMSHRAKEFDEIITEAEKNLRILLKIPDNYSVLFMQGGARTQFDSSVMNLCSEPDKHTVEYIINGTWSKMAAKEAEKYAKVERQLLMSEKFDRLPTKEELINDKDGLTLRYYCDNETIEGVEFNYIPEHSSGNVPLVCDMTSNFISRPIDISKFGIIFAGAQKNMGLSGLCIVIVRKDLIGKQMRFTPTLQNYQQQQANRSLLNTPLTFAIYVANLCFKWALNRGGLEAIDEFSRKKSKILYNLIDNSAGFYTCPVSPDSRSRMNVTFLIHDKSLDAKFLEEAKQAHLYDLKGHRSVGGFRASIYNAITLEDVERLAKFMTDFQLRYSN